MVKNTQKKPLKNVKEDRVNPKLKTFKADQSDLFFPKGKSVATRGVRHAVFNKTLAKASQGKSKNIDQEMPSVLIEVPQHPR